MRRGRFLTSVAAVAALGLMVAACGSDDSGDEDTTTTAAAATTAPSDEATTTAPGEGTDTTASLAPDAGAGKLLCEVTDVGGVDDKGFNALAAKGLDDAATQFGTEQPEVLESSTDADYAPNLTSLIGKNCDLIVTVGFLLGDATKAAAEANPDVNFAIVDNAYDPHIPNVRELTFSTDQSSFLAGYLAAGMTKSGTVGTFGGINIPPVSIFMDGFALGVQYYNEQKGTDVKVLGWDTASQDGQFTGNFDSTDDGKNFAKSLADEGADIIFPVAGPVGLGSAQFALDSGGEVSIIGVDNDLYVSAPEYKSVYLASVLKNIDAAVLDTARNIVADGSLGDNYNGTLENGGTGLSEFHDYDSQVPAELKAELEQVQADIIAGTITTHS